MIASSERLLVYPFNRLRLPLVWPPWDLMATAFSFQFFFSNEYFYFVYLPHVSWAWTINEPSLIRPQQVSMRPAWVTLNYPCRQPSIWYSRWILCQHTLNCSMPNRFHCFNSIFRWTENILFEQQIKLCLAWRLSSKFRPHLFVSLPVYLNSTWIRSSSWPFIIIMVVDLLLVRRAEGAQPRCPTLLGFFVTARK